MRTVRKRHNCIYVQDDVCEGSIVKGTYSCNEEHRISMGESKACIDLFALPPHIKRDLVSLNVLDEIKQCSHLCMIFSEYKGECARETEMRNLLNRFNIGCRIYLVLSISAHEERGADNCRSFWTYMLTEMHKKVDYKKRRMLERFIKSKHTFVRYEEYVGLDLHTVSYNNVGSTRAASVVITALESFIHTFIIAWRNAQNAHGDLHSGNITYSVVKGKGKIAVIDYGYTTLHDLRNHILKRSGQPVRNDFVLLLINFCTFFLVSDSISEIHEIFKMLETYPPEIILFVSFVIDLSKYKQNTFQVCIEQGLRKKFTSEAYIRCFQIFNLTNPLSIAPHLCTETHYDDLYLVNHATAYSEYFEKAYSTVNLIFYLDYYQLTKTLSIFLSIWCQTNHAYIESNPSETQRIEKINKHLTRTINRPLSLMSMRPSV